MQACKGTRATSGKRGDKHFDVCGGMATSYLVPEWMRNTDVGDSGSDVLNADGNTYDHGMPNGTTNGLGIKRVLKWLALMLVGAQVVFLSNCTAPYEPMAFSAMTPSLFCSLGGDVNAGAVSCDTMRHIAHYGVRQQCDKDGTCEGTGRSRRSVVSSAWPKHAPFPSTR